MIVALDATILVRATKRSQGPARRVVDEIIGNFEHVLISSEYILGEVGKVLSYPRMRVYFALRRMRFMHTLSSYGRSQKSWSRSSVFRLFCPTRMTILSFTPRSPAVPMCFA